MNNREIANELNLMLKKITPAFERLQELEQQFSKLAWQEDLEATKAAWGPASEANA